MKIDPWTSIEIKDYNKIMNEFGIEPIKNLYKKLPIQHHYLRRGIIFGHKDFDKIVDAVNEKKPFVMMTGLMPSGKFHLGHKIVADMIVYFQKLGAECYVAVADIEATLTRDVKREEAKKVAIEHFVKKVLENVKTLVDSGKYTKMSVGFSDDDLKNVKASEDFIENELKHMYPEFHFVVYDTSEGGKNKLIIQKEGN